MPSLSEFLCIMLYKVRTFQMYATSFHTFNPGLTSPLVEPNETLSEIKRREIKFQLAFIKYI